jgi:fructokinase
MIRLGVDFGGTKIEIAALDDRGVCVARRREPNPGSYGGALQVVRDLVAWADGETGTQGLPVGVGMPGSLSPATGRVRNANSTWLNGEAFDVDLAEVLQRPVRLANDANCFTLSEATDGAGRGRRTVFGVILGTGCGGGVTVDGALIDGANRIAGEWGHTPLPWAGPADRPARACWCGRPDCVETWV